MLESVGYLVWGNAHSDDSWRGVGSTVILQGNVGIPVCMLEMCIFIIELMCRYVVKDTLISIVHNSKKIGSECPERGHWLNKQF